MSRAAIRVIFVDTLIPSENDVAIGKRAKEVGGSELPARQFEGKIDALSRGHQRQY